MSKYFLSLYIYIDLYIYIFTIQLRRHFSANHSFLEVFSQSVIWAPSLNSFASKHIDSFKMEGDAPSRHFESGTLERMCPRHNMSALNVYCLFFIWKWRLTCPVTFTLTTQCLDFWFWHTVGAFGLRAHGLPSGPWLLSTLSFPNEKQFCVS